MKTSGVRTRLVLAIFLLFSASILLAAQTAAPKRIKAIRIVGNKRTQDIILQRELSSLIGQPFLKDYADFTVNRLDRLRIFSGIKVTPVEEEDGIVLVVEVKETFPIIPSFSLSFSDENGVLIGAGFSALNLKGKALFLSSRVVFGGATNVEFRLVNPWISGDKFAYSLDFYYRERRNEAFDFNETAYEIYTTFLRRYRDRWNYGARISLQYIRSDVPGKTVSADNADYAPGLSAFLGYDSRDSWTNPHSGWWSEFEIQKVGVFFGDCRFWRVNLDARRYQPVAPHHTLALFSLLTLTSGAVGRDVAAWQQFSVGGANSLRGWELGERAGKNQFLNTLEYRYNFFEPRPLRVLGISFFMGAQLAAFADLGYVWTEAPEFRPGNFLGGVGVGLRLIIPYIGLSRLDLAWGQPGVGIRFCIGSYEKPVRQRERVR
jgi:outer membrane protein insertion porin family